MWGEQGSLLGLGLTGVGHWARPSTITTLILSMLYNRKVTEIQLKNKLSTTQAMYRPSPVSQYGKVDEFGAPIGYTMSRSEVEVQRFGSTTNYVLNLRRQV